MTYCAAPGHAPDVVVVVADRTPLSDSSSASSGTHPGTCSLRPPFNTTLLGGSAARGLRPGHRIRVGGRGLLGDPVVGAGAFGIALGIDGRLTDGHGFNGG